MEKHQAVSLIIQTGKGAGDRVRSNSSCLMLPGYSAHSDRAERDAISRCIALWAALYRHNATERDTMNIHRRDLPALRAFDW